MARGGEGNDLGATSRPGDARDRRRGPGLSPGDGPDRGDRVACGVGDRASRVDRGGRRGPVPDRGAEAQNERASHREDPLELAPLERGRALLRRSRLHGLSGALLLLALSVACSALANPVTLHFTLPTTNALVIDSTVFDCEGGPPLNDLWTARLYGWPAYGGLVRRLLEHSVAGMEGADDSFTVDASWGWHFYVTTADMGGHESCASNYIFACSPCQITGVDSVATWDPVVRTQLYDVQGRLIHGPPRASGIYYPVDILKSGRRVIGRKVVYVK